MKWPRKRTCWLVAALILLPVLLVVFEHYRGKWALAHWKAKQEARGETFNLDDLIPPVPPDASNAYADVMSLVPAIQQASAASDLGPPQFRFPAPGKAILSVHLPAWRAYVRVDGKDQSTNVTWPVFSAAMKPHESVLDELQAALSGRVFHAPLDYHAGFSAPLNHFALLNSMPQLICPAVLVELQAGRLDPALDRLECLISICRGMEHERLISSQLVRFAMYGMTIGPTWQALELDGWSSDQLLRLQKLHQNHDFLSAMTRSLEMDRAMQGPGFEKLRQSSSNVLDLIGVQLWVGPGGPVRRYANVGPEWMPDELKETFLRFTVVPLWQTVWSYEDEQYQLASVQSILEGARAAATNREIQSLRATLRRLEEAADEAESVVSLRYLASPSFAAALGRSVDKALMIQTERAMLITAIALKRYGQKHGRWPAELADLVPEFLPEVPCDYLDGQSLRYRVGTNGTYTLYSVGQNGEDDGGDPTQEGGSSRHFGWQSGKDMIWPKPASAEEIEAYERGTKPDR